jgi:aryl-alcohol dehydrogenase-like predicted oxidoreductase
VHALGGVAHDAGLTPAQLALAWLVAQAGVVPLPGMRRVDHVEENAVAASAELSDDVLRRLEELFARGAVSGDRYPGYAAAWLDHGTPVPEEPSAEGEH